MQNNGKKTILVIDDEEVIGKLIKRIIGNNGYSIIVCTSSLEALTTTKNTTPELIISDFNLPCYSNGVDLCVQIQQSTNRNMPVIIISGQAENEVKAKQNGFEFICKPLDRSKLLPLVDECLTHSRHILCSDEQI